VRVKIRTQAIGPISRIVEGFRLIGGIKGVLKIPIVFSEVWNK
jgi:hypothetical protein